MSQRSWSAGEWVGYAMLALIVGALMMAMVGPLLARSECEERGLVYVSDPFGPKGYVCVKAEPTTP